MSDKTSVPAVTVIVAAYNCEDYIGECLLSLQEQTFADFECIVVDDCSTDDTVDAVRMCMEGDDRFALIALTKNGGPGAARNAALDRARGEYVMYVDADDRLAHDGLRKLIERARAQQLDELQFNAQSFYEDGAAMQVMSEDFEGRESFEDVATGPELFTFFSDRNQYFSQGALRMFRREMLEQAGVRFPEGIIHEDALFAFMAMTVSARSSFLNEPIYLRRQRAGSIMGARRRSVDSVIGHLTVISCVRMWVADNAANCDDAFLQAVGREVGLWSRLVAHDWAELLSDEERAAITEGLYADDRRALFFDILGAGDAAERAAAEYRDSQTYRLGDMIATVPRKARVRVRAFKNRRKVDEL